MAARTGLLLPGVLSPFAAILYGAPLSRGAFREPCHCGALRRWPPSGLARRPAGLRVGQRPASPRGKGARGRGVRAASARTPVFGATFAALQGAGRKRDRPEPPSPPARIASRLKSCRASHLGNDSRWTRRRATCGRWTGFQRTRPPSVAVQPVRGTCPPTFQPIAESPCPPAS